MSLTDPLATTTESEGRDDLEVKEEEIDVEGEEVWINLEAEHAVPGPSGQEHPVQRMLVVNPRSVPPMPPEGVHPFLYPEVPRNLRDFKKFKRLLEGRMTKGETNEALYIGHCEAFYFLSPEKDDWRCTTCFEEIAHEGWTVAHTHVVEPLNKLQPPVCSQCGDNPHVLSPASACSLCSYTFLLHKEQILAGMIIASLPL